MNLIRRNKQNIHMINIITLIIMFKNDFIGNYEKNIELKKSL